MSKITWVIVALLALSIAPLSGCAMPAKKAEQGFTTARLPKIERTIHNQIYGSVTQVLTPISYFAVDQDCLYKFKELFLDASGASVPDMSDVAEGDLLLMRNNAECLAPKEPLIKLVGITVEQYIETRHLLSMFLAGEYTQTDAQLNAAFIFLPGVKPIVITRHNAASYEVLFASDNGFATAVVDISNTAGKPILRSIGQWQ